MTAEAKERESGPSQVRHIVVADEETDLRLDRWFRRHYPDLGYGRLAKLLRTGQVRVDGRRVKAGARLAPGQSVRVPPLASDGSKKRAKPNADRPAFSDEDASNLQAAIIYRDNDIIALNKPAGLAVQGGTGTTRHLDAMLDVLTFDASERPRLVHRLDKDTSGVMLLARNVTAASKLTAAFRDRETKKTYWALVVGIPTPKRGLINQPLAKRRGAGGEKVMADEDGTRASTYYTILDTAARRATWLAMRPITGRTHQLRVHATVLGNPIVGDGKYGGSSAFLTGIANKLHLHSSSITFRHPRSGELMKMAAPLTGHMAETWKFLGLDAASDDDPFEELN